MRSGVLETGQRGLQISVPFVAGRESDKVMAKAHQTLQTQGDAAHGTAPGLQATLPGLRSLHQPHL